MRRVRRGSGCCANAPRVAVTLAAAFGPYLIFDMLFQETVTTRYALPLVVPVAFLAASGLGAAAPRWGVWAAAGVAAIALGGRPSDARLRMRARTPRRSACSPTCGPRPRRLRILLCSPSIAVRISISGAPSKWMGPEAPAFSERLGAPPRLEWLELVKYWNNGGRRNGVVRQRPAAERSRARPSWRAAGDVPVAAPLPRARRRRSTGRNGLVCDRSACLVSRRGLVADPGGRRCRGRDRQRAGSRWEPGMDPPVTRAPHADDRRPPAARWPGQRSPSRLDRRPHRGGTGARPGFLPANARAAGRRGDRRGGLRGASSSRPIRIASRSSSSTHNRQAVSCTALARAGTSTNTTRRRESCGAGRAIARRSASGPRERPCRCESAASPKRGARSSLTVKAGETVIVKERVGSRLRRQHEDSRRCTGPWRACRERDCHRDRRRLRAGGRPLAHARPPPARAEDLRVPDHSGFLARQSSELPNGLSNALSHQLSTRSAAASSALTGAGGTEMSCCA